LESALVTLALGLAPRLAHADVSGAIEGVVIDETTKRPVAGVTITVTSPALQGEQSEFSDARGHYIITELPPGEYTVRGYFSNLQVERVGLFLHADQMLQANLTIPISRGEVKTYRIKERSPSVDIGSAQVTTVITKDLYNNAPFTTGAGANGYGPVQQRDFSSLLAIVPSSNDGSGAVTNGRGAGFGGATASENQFQVDGVSVNEIATGIQGLHLSVEFIKELEVVTAGFNAEYGRATGGVANAITKSGSNEFHGDAWFYYSPPGLTPPAIGGLAQAIAVTGTNTYALDFGADIGGPIIKDRIWFYAGVAPNIGGVDSTAIYRRRTANDIPAGFMGAYPGDTITINTPACPGYLASSALCPSGNLANKTFNLQELANYNEHDRSTLQWHNWIAKLDFQLSENNHLAVSYIGVAQDSSGRSAGAGSIASRSWDSQLDVQTNVMAHWTSKLLNRRLQVEVHAGYFKDAYTPRYSGASLSEPSITYRGTYDLTTFQPGIGGCNPTTPATGVTFNPCPVTGYSVGGVGTISLTTNQRFLAMADVIYFLRLAGTHALKLGGDVEWTQEDTRNYHPAGGTYRVNSNGSVGENLYASVNGNVVTVLPSGSDVIVSGVSSAAYLRDSWNVGFVRGLTVNLGVRWDGQQLKGDDGKAYIGIWNNWAPRVGFAYDFTHKGLSRIYANYGMYYESIPLTLMAYDFSSQLGTVNNLHALPNTCKSDAQGLINLGTCQFPTMLTPANVALGSVALVAPNLSGQSTNELVTGIEYDVGWDMIVGVSYTHRQLGSVVEDLAPTGNGNEFIVGNPGQAVNANAISRLQDQIKVTADPTAKALLQQTLTLYRATASEGKPVRDYNALQITLAKRLSHNFVVNASYQYSRTLGNYPGTYDASINRLAPNVSTIYDFRYFAGQPNAYGPLPQDQPHIIKIAGSYQVPLHHNLITVGAAFYGASGHPIDVLGSDASYSLPEVYILPRGSGGRTPFTTQLNLHLGFARQLTKSLHAELTADIFNLFNEQGVTNVDTVYTTATVNAVSGGTANDLRNLRDINGAPVLLNPNFGQPTGYQAPLSARIGARLSF
jgi:hypothetical protein